MATSTETASLILRADATEITKGSEALDKLTVSAEGASRSVDKLAESEDQAKARIKAMVQASMEKVNAQNASISAGQREVQMTDAQRAAVEKLNKTSNTQVDMNARGAALLAAEDRARKQATASVADQTGALSRLIGQIDPTVAAYERLDAMQAKLAAFKKSGAIGADDYVLLTGKIEAMRGEVGKASTAMHGLSLNSSMARREMGRLVVDVANGNWGRLSQTSMTLANYTGLLGKAFTGAGLAITSTLGVLGLFSVAALKGYLAEQKLNTSLIATGNYAGTTTLALDNMAKSLVGGATTIGRAKDAVGALATSGKFTSQQISLLAQATVDGGQLMGKSVQQMISDFEKLQDSPVQASEALTAQYHYLTTATLQQIDALQKQGNTSDAANLALKSYADALGRRAKEAEDQLGTLQKAWNSVKSSASFAWDAMLGVGRTTTPLGQIQQQYDDLFRKITAVQTVASGRKPGFIEDQFLPADIAQGAGGNWGFLSSAPTDDAVSRAKLELPVLLQQAHDLQAKMATMQATESAKTAAEGVAKQVQQDGNDAIKTLDRLGISLDGVKSKTDKVAEAAKALYAIHLAGGKLPAGVDFNGVQADMPEGAGWDKIKSQLLYGSHKGPDLDSGLPDANSLLAKSVQADIKVDQQQLSQWAKNTTALQAYKDAMNERLATDKASLQLRIDSIGMGQKEIALQTQLIQIRKEADQQVSQLNTPSNRAHLSQDEYAQRLQAIKDFEQKRVSAAIDADKQITAAQSDWTKGFTSALANYTDQAANVATQTATLFTNAFTGMSDSLANFVTTGKINFTSLSQSILSDLIKIETQILVSKALTSIFGGMSTTQQSELSTGANAFIGSVMNAKGNVYDSPSLSAYSNQIVNRPTPFLFASGAGIMGEAGPEAIMPLTRGSNGKLGVQASSAGGVEVEINITNNGQPVQAQQTGMQQNGKKVIIDMVLTAVSGDIAKGGQTAKAMQQRFGLSRRGVPVGN